MPLSKSELRKDLIKIRQAILTPEREAAAVDLLENVKKMPEFIAATKIAFYWPHNDEIDCLPLLKEAMRLNKHCFLPVLCLNNRQTLAFAAYHKSTTMIKNRYDIPEPDMDTTTLIASNELDIIFAPLVGFDSSGWRLGRGGGFYDATFADLARTNSDHLPLLIGLGYDCQQVPAVPVDTWDRQLDAVVTESQTLRF